MKPSPTASALRAAGYVPVPRLWVKPSDVDALIRKAETYGPEINRIRAEVRENLKAPE